jgi:hypothetical protein
MKVMSEEKQGEKICAACQQVSTCIGEPTVHHAINQQENTAEMP